MKMKELIEDVRDEKRRTSGKGAASVFDSRCKRKPRVCAKYCMSYLISCYYDQTLVSVHEVDRWKIKVPPISASLHRMIHDHW